MAKSVEERIREAVEAKRNQIVGMLSDLIKIPSTNGEEGKAQEFLIKKLKSMGLKVDAFEPDIEELKKHPAFYLDRRLGEFGLTFKDRPQVVGVLKGKGGGRSLLFNAHIDVMPPGPVELWEHDPFSGLVKDGVIYGRGVADCKGGIVAQTMALEALMDAGVTLKGDVILESVCEESSSNGTLGCLLRGYRADAGICTEGTANQIAPAQMGGIVYRIKTYGTSASVLRDTSGVSALDQVFKLKNALANFSAIRRDQAHHDIINPKIVGLYVGNVLAGTWANMFPMDAWMEGAMRFLPNEDAETVRKQLVDYVAKFAALDPTMQERPPVVSFWQSWEAAEIPVDHPIVKTVQAAYKTSFGHEGKIGGREGGTDTWIYTKYGNTPMLCYGPGRPDKMHVINESLEIEELIEVVHVLAQTMASWCGVAK